MARILSLKIVQFNISLNISENFNRILQFLDSTSSDQVIVFPEGALSGYSADNSFLDRIDNNLLEGYINNLKDEAVSRGIHIIFGSCIKESKGWFNAGLYLGANGEYHLYKKINLAHSEREAFCSGDELGVFEIKMLNFRFKAAFQLCREIRYPEQWQLLASEGAELFFYLTNAVGDIDIAPIWRSHLVSRAAENQRFICGANAADENQKCPTLVVGPQGKILCEELSENSIAITAVINLDEVSNWNLNQRRTDVVITNRK